MTLILKPCPFCGGPAEFEQMGYPHQFCIVACTSCETSHVSPDEGDLSGSSWNRRVARPVFAVEPDGSVRFRYRNHWGEVAERHVRLGGSFGSSHLGAFIYWGANEYHQEWQWLINAWDIDKDAMRTFALKDILVPE